MTLSGVIRAACAGLVLGAALPGTFAQTPVVGPAPVIAAEEDPDARLQIVIKNVYIRDDNDWGAGEIRIHAWVQRCSTITASNVGPPVCANERIIVYTPPSSFSADSGDTVTLNRTIPKAGDAFQGSPDVVGESFSVYGDSSYMVSVSGLEMDSVTANESLGKATLLLRKESNWEIGSHSLPAWGAYYDGGTRREMGDFTVNFEIRKAPLSDLAATQFRVVRIEGTDRQVICMGITNLGELDAASVPVVLRIGSPTPMVGRFNFPGLTAGEWRERCEFIPDIPPGDHPTSFTIDDERRIPEMNEDNNAYQSRFSFGSPPQAPAPATGPKDVDLAARGIAVQASNSGSPGCFAGRNTVNVLVKNEGQAAAPAFRVKLEADGDDYEQSVAGLDGGKEITTTFANIDLKKGMRTFKVKVDARNAVEESDDGDNELKITMNCREE